MRQIPTPGTVEEPAPEHPGVYCEGYMAALAHNVLKMVRKLGYCVGHPGPAAPGAAAIANAEFTMADAATDSTVSPQYFSWLG